MSEILKNVFSNSTTTAVRDGLVNTTISVLQLSQDSHSLVEDPSAVNCTNSSPLDLTTVEVDFKALQYSMLITVIVELLGAAFFFATAW